VKSRTYIENPNENKTFFQESAWNPRLAYEQKQGSNGKMRVTVMRK